MKKFIFLNLKNQTIIRKAKRMRLESIVFRVPNHTLNEQLDETFEAEITIEKSPVKRGRTGKKNKDYVQHSVHNNYMDCKKIIDCGFENQFWTRQGKYTTNEGDKINYTCKGFKECPRRLLVLLDRHLQNATILLILVSIL